MPAVSADAIVQSNPPFYPNWWTSYHTKVRLERGEALCVDTGAVFSLSGDAQMFRMAQIAKEHGHGTAYSKLTKPLSIDGVGQNSSGCTRQASVPIVMSDGKLAVYKAPMIDNSQVPALLGLTTMTEQRVLLDLLHNRYITVGPGGYKVELSPGSAVLDLERAPTGHLMLAASEWTKLQNDRVRKPAVFNVLPQ